MSWLVIALASVVSGALGAMGLVGCNAGVDNFLDVSIHDFIEFV